MRALYRPGRRLVLDIPYLVRPSLTRPSSRAGSGNLAGSLQPIDTLVPSSDREARNEEGVTFPSLRNSRIKCDWSA